MTIKELIRRNLEDDIPLDELTLEDLFIRQLMLPILIRELERQEVEIAGMVN